MAIDANSVAGDVAASIEIIGGIPPYRGSFAGSPNDFLGCLDIVATDSDEIFNLVLNALGVETFPNGSPTGELTGQVTITDALRRSVTFEPFSIPWGLAPTVAGINLLHSIS